MSNRFNIYKIASLLIVITAILIPLVYSKLKSQRFKTKMATNSVVVSGEVKKFVRAYKRTDAFEFLFQFSGEEYLSYTSSAGKQSDYQQLSEYVIGKNFPVVINPENPRKYSVILIVPKDFEEYGLKFPDSLKWVLKYIEK